MTQERRFIGRVGLKTVHINVTTDTGVQQMYSWVVRKLNWKQYNKFLEISDNIKDLEEGKIDPQKLGSLMEEFLLQNIVKTPDNALVDQEYINYLEPDIAQALFQAMLPEVDSDTQKK